ncbi:MAG: LPXTG cell wall anchor domain-containing protein, partial [Actinobacteria bacterium]|nr:LPXTG cell wall anchor domain-containing protein [Actinomycetota bacterium]
LEAVLDVRAADSGLICGIAGYPAQECGAEIDMDILTAPINDIAPVSDTESSSGNSPALLALAVVALLVGLVAVRRRKKS